MPLDCSGPPAPICIREELRTCSGSRRDAVLHAYMDGQLIGALDFTCAARRIRVNVLYVKPDFRRRGVARALLRHLSRRYPDCVIVPARLK